MLKYGRKVKITKQGALRGQYGWIHQVLKEHGSLYLVDLYNNNEVDFSSIMEPILLSGEDFVLTPQES